ncbi:MAG: PilZ domain-containing protein, partial [Planctomycetota bacterium]
CPPGTGPKGEAIAQSHDPREELQAFAASVRRSVMAPCAVKCFISGTPVIRRYPGYVRNVSVGGAGIVTTRPMIRGEPVEVVIEPRHEPGSCVRLGGLVAYCRHLEGGIYEVGIQVVTRSGEPIFARDAESPDGHPEWVLEALRATHGTDLPYRQSA